MILMLPGAPPQQVQQIRRLLLPLWDVQPLHCDLSDICHQQVPPLPVFWLRPPCVHVVLHAPRGEAHEQPQPHVRGLPQAGGVWLREVRPGGRPGEEERSVCARPQHDQRQDLPGGLVLVPRPRHHRHLQTHLQNCHTFVMEFQVKVLSVERTVDSLVHKGTNWSSGRSGDISRRRRVTTTSTITSDTAPSGTGWSSTRCPGIWTRGLCSFVSYVFVNDIYIRFYADFLSVLTRTVNPHDTEKCNELNHFDNKHQLVINPLLSTIIIIIYASFNIT